MHPDDIDKFLDEVKLNKLTGIEKDEIIKKYWNDERQKSYDEAKKLSQRHSRVPYNSSKKRKKDGTKKQIIATLLVFSLASGMTYATYKEYGTYKEKLDIEKELSESVLKNKSHGSYSIKDDEYYWWYSDESINNIINSLLQEHPEYDIDTKIYCCYKALPEYKRMDYLDRIVSGTTSYPNFELYLNSKRMSLDEYIKTMEKVLRSYAKAQIAQEKAESLVEELNETPEGGSR